jgi:hypothetical protein
MIFKWYLFSSSLSIVTILGTQTIATAQLLPPSPPPDTEEASGDGFFLEWVAPNLSPSPESTPNDGAAVIRRPIYRVEVLGNSDLLLEQVRKVEPEAFKRDRVIQAGLFSTEANAQQQVQNLERQGIPSRIVTVNSEQETVATRLTAGPAYYVVVPSRRKNLDELEAQIRRLDIESADISQREVPRGPHLAVGPFQQRAQAGYWNNYLRSAGFDARLYFGN